ncbi:MAG: hypothetical protein NZ937_06425 [Armatimonadetes bacterium]|nr:hypothetical protein [Armatimonadota bacterium]
MVSWTDDKQRKFAVRNDLSLFTNTGAERVTVEKFSVETSTLAPIDISTYLRYLFCWLWAMMPKENGVGNEAL